MWPVLLAQVLSHPQLIFPSKTWFFGIFSGKNHLKNQYLPHCESISYQINAIKSCSSRSFQQHQRHISIPPKFFNYDLIKILVKKSVNIQELLHRKSKHHGTKPMQPYSLRAFQRHHEYNLKHPDSVDSLSAKQNKTKQYKLSSFIDR